MNKHNFVPAASLVMIITRDHVEETSSIIIKTGDENTASTMEEITVAIDETIAEIAKGFGILPSQIRLLTVDEAEEFGYYCQGE